MKGPKRRCLDSFYEPEPMSGCWIWIGRKSWDGYGRYGDLYAHRIVYEESLGPITPGLDLDHLCRNRACVNPRHLEPVTRRENLLRGNGASAVAVRTNKCKRGHDLVDGNLYTENNGKRHCRACQLQRAKRP